MLTLPRSRARSVYAAIWSEAIVTTRGDYCAEKITTPKSQAIDPQAQLAPMRSSEAYLPDRIATERCIDQIAAGAILDREPKKRRTAARETGIETKTPRPSGAGRRRQ
jgi:hypothetical protein